DGRIRGQRGWVVDMPVDEDDDEEAASVRAADRPGHDASRGGEPAGSDASPPSGGALRAVVERLLVQFYGGRAADDGATAVPREILVPALPRRESEISAWLADLRGTKVSLRVPRRGDKRALADTVTANAVDALRVHHLR